MEFRVLGNFLGFRAYTGLGFMGFGIMDSGSSGQKFRLAHGALLSQNVNYDILLLGLAD